MKQIERNGETPGAIMSFMFRRRYVRIVSFFFRTALSFIWWDVVLSRIGFRKAAVKTRPERIRRVAAAFRRLAVRMGGVMIKVGQFLSARLDVLPREITDELAGLQDEVAPEAFENIRAVIEAEFGCRLNRSSANLTLPMASASIGQVHYAHLCVTDRRMVTLPAVVVKVQRPHIEEIVEIDLAALRMVGGWLQRYRPIRKRANVPRLLDEFSRVAVRGDRLPE